MNSSEIDQRHESGWQVPEISARIHRHISMFETTIGAANPNREGDLRTVYGEAIIEPWMFGESSECGDNFGLSAKSLAWRWFWRFVYNLAIEPDVVTSVGLK